MSNRSLDSYVAFKKRMNESISDEFALMTISRISDALKYLFSNSLIHRDLKPSNILLDNDFIPYISDLDTIREMPNLEELGKERYEKEDFTQDIGTTLYSAPEQESGIPSLSSDIYSFGLNIYYLYQKEHMWSHIGNAISLKKDENVLEMTNVPVSIRELYKNCVKFAKEDRLTDIDEIIEIIICEIISIDKNHLLNIKASISVPIIYEYFMIETELSPIDYYFDQLLSLKLDALFSKEKISSIYLELGNRYELGKGLRTSYKKAKYFYELAAQENNSEANVNLGKLYYNGYGVQKDDMIAVHYFEIAENQKNSDASFWLGDLYYESGDYLKAKHYFEKAAEQINSDALLGLGKLYENGFGVEQNYISAFKCYLASSMLNNPDALFRLGCLYYIGRGVERDREKAIQLFFRAVKYKSTDALNFLSTFFETCDPWIQEQINLIHEVKKVAIIHNSGNMSMGDYPSFGILHNKKRRRNEIIFASEGNIIFNYNTLPYSMMPMKSNSLILIGKYFYYGLNGLCQNYLKAKYYFELAADNDNSYGFYYLGDMYEKGNGVRKDIEKAKMYYENSKSLGNPYGYLALGNLYLNGNGVEKNYTVAKNLIEQSAEIGYPNAQIALNSVEKNCKEAKDLIANMDKQNISTDTFLYMGNICLFGYGVKKDYTRAKAFFEIAAEQGCPDAYLRLGFLYEKGYGVEQNYTEALQNYKKLTVACDYNDVNDDNDDNDEPFYGIFISNDLNGDNVSQKILSDALFSIGNLYENGHGVTKNIDKAIHYYKSSSNLGNSNADLRLGLINIFGTYYGIAVDYIIAKKYLEKSAIRGNSIAYLELGLFYEKGLDGKKDYSKAKDCYEKSSKLKNTDALIKLGNLFMKGNGVEKSFEKAKEYYIESSKLNNPMAFLILGNIHMNIEKNYIIAKDYYEKAGKERNPEALFRLGYLFSNGITFDEDIEKAIGYFLKCIEIAAEGSEKIELFNPEDNTISYELINNYYYYPACTNIGLYQILFYNNFDEAYKYLSKSGYGSEYPYSQYCFGLFLQFYKCKELEQAIRMYEGAHRHKFALAEFILGYLYEDKNEFEKSIYYYEEASNHEDEPLIYKGIYFDDIRLEVSKTFIICFTNLKLAYYYFSQLRYFESKKYFIKAFSKLHMKSDDQSYSFQYSIQKDNLKGIFKYLEEFIIHFPLFNLDNQPDLYKQSESTENGHINDPSSINVKDQNMNDVCLSVSRNEENSFKEIALKNHLISIDENKFIVNQIEEKMINDPESLFNYNFENESFKNIFSEGLNNIIKTMKEIMHKEPYKILFGRISVEKPKKKNQSIAPSIQINDLFYDGFYD